MASRLSGDGVTAAYKTLDSPFAKMYRPEPRSLPGHVLRDIFSLLMTARHLRKARKAGEDLAAEVAVTAARRPLAFVVAAFGAGCLLAILMARHSEPDAASKHMEML